jgi:hypothetical protein
MMPGRMRGNQIYDIPPVIGASRCWPNLQAVALRLLDRTAARHLLQWMCPGRCGTGCSRLRNA